MSKKRTETDLKNTENENKNDTKAYLWAGLAGCVIGAVMFGLTFVPQIGAYGCIASFICELASLSFINTQKKKNPLPACKPIEIVCYVIGIAVIALLIGAAIYSSVNK